MTSKLVLEIDNNLLEEIDDYVKKHNTSIRKMIEDYFEFIAAHKDEDTEFTPVLSEISGILNIDKTPEELLEEYKDYIVKKHLTES